MEGWCFSYTPQDIYEKAQCQVWVASFWLVAQWDHKDPPQTANDIGTALGYPLEFDGMVLWLNMPLTWTMERGEIWKLRPYCLPFIVPDGSIYLSREKNV